MAELVVYKYPVPAADRPTLHMPRGAEFPRSHPRSQSGLRARKTADGALVFHVFDCGEG